jgi:hypothetical protein
MILPAGDNQDEREKQNKAKFRQVGRAILMKKVIDRGLSG